MISGRGAFLYGGRWNTKGTLLVYLGGSLSLATLEILVNAPNATSIVRGHYRCLELSFDSDLVCYVDPSDLPDNWAKPGMSSPVSHIGDQWAREQSAAILRVPSAVIPVECNYLLNPNHPDAALVTHGDIQPFSIDARLIKT